MSIKDLNTLEHALAFIKDLEKCFLAIDNAAGCSCCRDNDPWYDAWNVVGHLLEWKLQKDGKGFKTGVVDYWDEDEQIDQAKFRDNTEQILSNLKELRIALGINSIESEWDCLDWTVYGELEKWDDDND